jgi:hypothetical protein
MESELNPYAPGSGLRPPAMAGRDGAINSFDLMGARSKRHLHNRGMVLSGLRGVGKTVLLNSLRSQADKMGWLTVGFEGRPGGPAAEAIREKLARELLLGARKFVRRPAAELLREAVRSVRSFSATLGISGVEFGFEKATGRADSGRLDIDLEEMNEDLSEALKSVRSAFAIFIDEMQDLDPELLAALITVQHSAGQREWPFYIIGAGLPNLPGKLSEARSYAERLFDYRQIGPLDEASSMRALEEPAVKFGARFRPQALQTLLHAAGGYPYFIQEFGKAIWDIAPECLFTASSASPAGPSLTRGSSPRGGNAPPRQNADICSTWPKTATQAPGTTAVANRMGTYGQRPGTCPAPDSSAKD